MGIIALPQMLKRNYDKKLAMGSIAAGGALGILIPPSVIFILYGVLTGVSIGSGMIFRAMNSTVTMNLNTILGTRGACWSISSACSWARKARTCTAGK